MVVPVDRASFKEYCLDNKYSRWYFSIIDKAIDRCWNKDNAPCYIEGHHFIPRSLGGNDDTIVFLTAREHFICHVLLTKILISEDKAKMCLALYRLLNGNQKNYCKSSILYEKIKIEHSIACSLRSVKYWSQFTKEQRSSMRNGIKNGRFGKEVKESTRQKISKANKGRLIGDKHPLWKIGHSDESKRKMSLTRKIKQIKGKKWFNNGIVETFDLPENKPNDFTFGRLRRGN